MKMKTLSRSFRRDLVTYGMVVVMFLAIQLLSGMGMLTNSLSGQLVPICAYIIMAISLNLTVGILGELSLGHAGFMSVGGFVGAFVSVCVGDAVPGWLCFTLALLAGTAAAALFGFLIGIPVLRLQGDYLAIVTLAFGEIIKNLLNSFYVGRDASGFHVSLKDALSLNLDETGDHRAGAAGPVRPAHHPLRPARPGVRSGLCAQHRAAAGDAVRAEQQPGLWRPQRLHRPAQMGGLTHGRAPYRA